jgi:hypothetical protein
MNLIAFLLTMIIMVPLFWIFGNVKNILMGDEYYPMFGDYSALSDFLGTNFTDKK